MPKKIILYLFMSQNFKDTQCRRKSNTLKNLIKNDKKDKETLKRIVSKVWIRIILQETFNQMLISLLKF